MITLLSYRLGGRQICQSTNNNTKEVHLRFSLGSLILSIFLLVPLGGCVTLDGLASVDSWFTAEPLATYAGRNTEPIVLTPLAGDEIAISDEEFKPFDFSLTLGSVLPQEQIDLHKANLISLLTNKASRGSIAPWEGSIELGQQISSTAIWLASLETKYEPDLHIEIDSEFVPMGTLAMGWMEDEVNTNIDPIENESDVSITSSIIDVSQNPLGISTGIFASTSGSDLAWAEIISISLRWIAMVFLAVVLLIPACCSCASQFVGKEPGSSPSMRRRRRSDDHAPSTSAISRAISNVPTR